MMKTYWKLSKHQEKALKTYCSYYKTLVDIGAGNLSLSEKCIDLGAKRVYAIDSKFEDDLSHTPRIKKILCDLSKSYPSHEEVPCTNAIISWPPGVYGDDGIKLVEHPNWLNILPRLDSVLYIGKNSDQCTCGLPFFWGILMGWKCGYVIPYKPNNMIFYINVSRPKNEPLNMEELYSLANGKLPYIRKTDLAVCDWGDEIMEIFSGWRKHIGIEK